MKNNEPVEGKHNKGPKETKEEKEQEVKLFVNKLLLLLKEKVFHLIMQLLMSTALRMKRPGQLELNMLFIRLSNNLS